MQDVPAIVDGGVDAAVGYLKFHAVRAEAEFRVIPTQPDAVLIRPIWLRFGKSVQVVGECVPTGAALHGVAHEKGDRRIARICSSCSRRRLRDSITHFGLR